MSQLDPKLVRHALTVARKHGFAEVEIGIGDECFSAKLDQAAKKSRESGIGSAAADIAPELEIIASSLVGYYQEARQPLRVGMKVHAGDVIAVVAALGIANDVESNVSGEVVEVLVEPNQPVEYGQALAKVKA